MSSMSGRKQVVRTLLPLVSCLVSLWLFTSCLIFQYIWQQLVCVGLWFSLFVSSGWKRWSVGLDGRTDTGGLDVKDDLYGWMETGGQ